MARRKNRKSDFVEWGAKMVALGLAFLLIPLWMNTSSPMFGPVFQVLRTPGWICLGVGALFLGLHFLGRKRPPTPTPVRSTGKGNQTVAAPVRPPSTDADTRGDRIADVWQDMERDQQVLRRSRGDAHSAAPMDLPSQWSAQVFDLIEWRRFEIVCESLFGQAGFQARSQSHGADGGVDIWLHATGFTQPVAVVQCKHWKNRPVPVEQIRAFFGVMTANDLKRGTFATSSTFTADALAFGRANGINMQDGAGLLTLIRARSPEQQADLLTVAFEGEFWKPSCPSCGDKLVQRTARKNKRTFWGCRHYPDCRYTRPITQTEATFLGQASAASTR